RQKTGGLTLEQKKKIRQELEKQKINSARAWKILLAAGIALAAVYIAGCCYYRSHFYGGGTVFGIPMRGQTAEALKEQIHQKVGEYQLQITPGTGRRSFPQSRLGCSMMTRAKWNSFWRNRRQRPGS